MEIRFSFLNKTSVDNYSSKLFKYQFVHSNYQTNNQSTKLENRFEALVPIK